MLIISRQKITKKEKEMSIKQNNSSKKR